MKRSSQLLLTCLLLGISAQCQAANLYGTTRLGSLPAPEVKIVVRSLEDNRDHVVVSGPDGSFRINELNPGRYEVSATKEGAGAAQPETIVLAEQQSMKIDLSLNAAKPAADTSGPVPVEKEIEELKRRIEELEGERSAPAPAPPAPQTPAPAATPDPAPSIPEALQAPASTPGPDNFTPFAFGDFTWLNGTPRNKDAVLDTKFFTPEVRFDTHFMEDFNQPRDHTMGGATESFRSGEFQVEQISVGGDFHWQNVRGRILTMYGLFATTTPRNDGSAGVGQWDVRERLQICLGGLGRIPLQREPRTECRCRNLRVVHRPVQLLQLRQLDLPAVVRVVEYAVVLQWTAHPVVPHEQAED